MSDHQALEARILDLEARLDNAQQSGRRRMRRLTATNVLVIVVVLAFGGAGAAYALVAANTVNSASIIDGSITHADVKYNSIGGSRLLDSSVTSSKIYNGTIRGVDIADHAIDQAQLREASVTAHQLGAVPLREESDPPYGSVFVGEVDCGGGFVAIAGGGEIDTALVQPPTLVSSLPVDGIGTNSVWKATWQTDGGNVNPQFIHMYAYCIDDGLL
jgi:hypothetical protein